MNYLNKLESIYWHSRIPDAPLISEKIRGEELFNLYLNIFPKDANTIYLSDSEYCICAIDDIRRFVKWSNANNYPYVPEVKDCDDFALALLGDFSKYPQWAGFPVSLIWADITIGPHAFVTAVAWPSVNDKTPVIYYIEPQTDFEISEEVLEDMKLMLLVI